MAHQQAQTTAHAPADRELEARPGATADDTRCFFLLQVFLHAVAIGWISSTNPGR